MDDVTFLQGLYAAGARTQMPVISMTAQILTGDPLLPPDPTEPRKLRHFEELRRVMVANNHTDGLLWITHLTWPQTGIQTADSIYQDRNNQAEWLSRAFQLTRAQLSIGGVFLNNLNAPRSGNFGAMLLTAFAFHPFIKTFQTYIQENSALSLISQ